MRVAALPRIRVHDLRHTTATVLLVAGVHPKVVQDLLGHRTIVVTMDTYSHVMPVLHLQAVQTLNSLLASPSLPDEGRDTRPNDTRGVRAPALMAPRGCGG